MEDSMESGNEVSRKGEKGVRFAGLALESNGKEPPAELQSSSGWNGLSDHLEKESAPDSGGPSAGYPGGFDRPTDGLKPLYEEMLAYIEKVYASAGSGEDFSVKEGESLVKRIADFGADQDSLFVLALHEDYRKRYLISHAANVSIFSIRLAENLGFDKKRTVETGLAALLHDIGTVRIPEEIISKKAGLTQKEMGILRQRPVFSHEILSGLGDDWQYLAQTAIQVYERIDGSGYPYGLAGKEINEYARIIGLVDVYEALIHSRPQRERFLHFSAIKEIIKTGKAKFERRCLKALVNVFSIFPLYSYIKLNSGAIGMVIGTHPDRPLRPRLKIIYDSRGQRLPADRIVDLTEHPLLYIVDSVEVDSVDEKSVA